MADALELSDLTRVALAKQASTMVEDYLTATIVRMSRGVGLNPWLFHPHSQRLWDRMCQGGDISVARLGPKEALISLYGMPLVSSRYFRMALCASWAQALERVCKKAYVRDIVHGESTASFRQSWV